MDCFRFDGRQQNPNFSVSHVNKIVSNETIISRVTKKGTKPTTQSS
jgi:hypothetical protein